MRLPLNSDNPEDINLKETDLMIQYALEHGINMFDTALLYHTNDRAKPGISETILGEKLKQYHDEVHISTKMPSWNMTSWEYFDNTLNHQLEQLQRDSIELFFVHSIKDSYYHTIKEKGFYSFIDRAVDDGRIEYVGFSSHGSYELLEEILEDYDNWSFALTQQNYIDTEENPGLKGLKKLHKLNIGTMIMEPLRGGQLAENLPPSIQEIFNQSGMNFSPIEWALYYLWDKKEVNCVLSGMNNLEQVKQNIELAEKSHTNMFAQNERETLEHVKAEYEKLNSIPCTSCKYCMPCPFGVDIPRCFREYNMDKLSGSNNASIQYKFHLYEDRKAHNCTNCGKCISVCPQSINIPEQLCLVAEHFRE